MKKLFEWYYKHIGKVFWIIAVPLLVLVWWDKERLPELRQVYIIGFLAITLTLTIDIVKIYKEYKTIQFGNIWGKVWWWMKHG